MNPAINGDHIAKERILILKQMKKLVCMGLIIIGTSCATNGTDKIDVEKVFPQDKVNRIDIKISAANWQTMLDDMTANYGDFDQGEWDDEETFWDTFWPTIDWPDENPVYVTCEVTFEDETWKNVGIRFKGASTLLRAWWGGSYKLPFKLDFDEFEDQFPETEGQRFFGFKKLSFTNNISDGSYLRHKVAADMFREEGVPAPHTTFYRVYIDKGAGVEYFGVYTVVETPWKQMFRTQFGKSGGNLYKGYGDSSADVWRELDFPDSSTFLKKTNIEEDDYSDIEDAVFALHSDMSNASLWRTNLEKEFDAENFMKWLAVNTVLQIWDISGNHYLYGDPGEGGRLNWIPWDFDSAFPQWDVSDQEGPFLGKTLLLDMSNSGGAIPLIDYLVNDEVYYVVYESTVENFATGNFEEVSLKARFEFFHDLIEPYVVGAEGEDPDRTFTDSDEFDWGLDDINEFIDDRTLALDSFLYD